MEWYEEIGLEQNPFIDTETTELVGYEDVIDEMFYRITAGDMLFIEGKEGSGKTALLKRVIARFKGRGKIIYLDGKKLDKNVNITEVLKKSLGFWKRLMGKEPENLILLMDDVEEVTKKNSERIKHYYDQNYVKAVVFTGTSYKTASFTDSLRERIGKVVKLKELSEDEAVDVAKIRLEGNKAMPDDIIREVYKRSDRNMRTFMTYCSKVMDYAIREAKAKTVTKEHVSTILDGMKEDKKKKKEEIEIKVEKVEDEKYKPTTITIIDDDFKPKKENKKDIAEKYY